MQSPVTRPTEARGIANATIAYVIWGLFPLFWRPLHAIAAKRSRWQTDGMDDQ